MYARLRFLARSAAPGFFMPFGDAPLALFRGTAAVSVLALGVLVGAGCFAFSGCSGQTAGPVAVTVNGRPISVAEWSEERKFAEDADPDGSESLDNLIDQALILQQGQRLGLKFGKAERAKALAGAMDGVDTGVLEASLKERGLSLTQWQDRVALGVETDAAVSLALRSRLRASDQEVLDRYWEHLLLYREPPRRILRQIYTRTRGAAESAMRALEMGEPFAEVATSQGQGPEADQGGLLGGVARGQLPKALARAAWALKPGTYSHIVASHWGYHILYFESRLPGDAGSPVEAGPQAREDLLLVKEQAAFRTWLAQLRETAVIVRGSAAGPSARVAKPEKGKT